MLTVLDLFCGSGGFSEGFRQQGFEIVCGIDKWQPAVDTFNYNFGLDCGSRDLLDIAGNCDEIEQLPDTDIIIGSPPCVSFSSSNKSGYADKSLGIRLIEAYLKIVAVKRFQSNARLKAWFMENVVNAEKHMKTFYTFADLGLTEWAIERGMSSDEIALDIKDGKRRILNSVNFGVPQARKRLFVGGILEQDGFPTLEESGSVVSINKVFGNFPQPMLAKRRKLITDPNYKHLRVKSEWLTDYAYDTGIYESHWEYSKWCKLNHPYMGKMSFPENRDKPSRTVTATKLDNSREALIYDSEIKRVGDGQYRTPTIREIAVLMSFPITYQFVASSESAKWKLIGNAVCPLVSGAIAKSVLTALGKKAPRSPIVKKEHPNRDEVTDLNNADRKVFNNPPQYKKGKRLRRHPFKDGNMTVALSNYCLASNARIADGKWRVTITYGTGRKYKTQEFDSYDELRQRILSYDRVGRQFVDEVENGYSSTIVNAKELQNIYERNEKSAKKSPVDLVEDVRMMVESKVNGEYVTTGGIFMHKERVSKRQLFALYALSQVAKIANAGG